MALTYKEGTRLGDEINQLQQDFEVRLSAIKDKFFVDGKGLQVISGKDNYSIGFAVDMDLIKNQD